MYCPNCGRKLENPEMKFCPECGYNLTKADKQLTFSVEEHSSGCELRKAMFAICVLCAIAAIAIPAYCYAVDDGWSGGSVDWFESIGIVLTIILAVIAAIAGIIGVSMESG